LKFWLEKTLMHDFLRLKEFSQATEFKENKGHLYVFNIKFVIPVGF